MAGEKILTVPFHTQHWDLERWQEMGFADRVDAEYWERSSCGVLCLQMVIEYFHHKIIPIIDLIRQGQKLDGYTDRNGWSHDGLVSLAGAYRVTAQRIFMNPPELVAALEANRIPIISIKWGFELNKTWKERLLFWKKYGGHLAVVVGYKKENDAIAGFYVHHTSKRKDQNWIGRFVPMDVFHRGYTGRAIVVQK